MTHTGIGQTRRHQTDTSQREEEEEMTEAAADGVSIWENHSTEAARLQSRSSDQSSSGETQHFSKPSLSYIALIAKVILSSPSRKLNLASIYRAMEEQFPFLERRGSGWRNSVRHNLSVNTCFVKVSRCEDGRGHYWGIHRAHLRDFQQGNFRKNRKVKGRRETETYDSILGCLTWMETSCFLRKFCNRGSLGCTEPQCPLQEPRRYHSSVLDHKPEAHCNTWSNTLGWNVLSRWMRPCSDTRIGALAPPPPTATSHFWALNEPVLTGMRESYDSRFMTPPPHLLNPPNCWCVTPYNVNFTPGLS